MNCVNFICTHVFIYISLICYKEGKNHYCRVKLPVNDLRNMLMILLQMNNYKAGALEM